MLEFGHDVDNFYATSTYRVFKPVGDGLSAVASYIKTQRWAVLVTNVTDAAKAN